MAQHQPIFQTKPEEHSVQIPVSIERDSTTLTNPNRKPNHWPTILLSTIFVIIGQSIAILLENLYYEQINRSVYNKHGQSDGVWTQALLQTVGFPLLLLPFIILLTTKKHNNNNNPPITSDQFHYKSLAVIYICIGILMSAQGRLSAMGKLDIPFFFFVLISLAQLFFTPIFARFINKIKFNRWVVISLVLAIGAGAANFTSTFGGEPDRREDFHVRGAWAALFAAVCFSLLLCNIQNVFDSYIFKRTEPTTRKPSFASVFEVIVFSSLVATLISAVGLLIAGEQHGLEREMNGFPKGKGAYVMVMVGQAVSWQLYWVGIVGLVFSVSSVLSNVINVVTWPLVSLLVVIFFNFKNFTREGDDEFYTLKGCALIPAALSVAAYFFGLHKENRRSAY
ncbi:putative purine permease 14 [Raphanus sativus]|uniref:Probable purine permease n=1 Tax=Raphanus sativus TaxID=3726 RepID=A0A6J0M8M5_RAPSA|nr:purine permease 14 [Raphanus sativus]KAJ4916209.1 putative purine permease 14 [Raphanus sativus]